jgi:hydroxymethylpyrimidine/phosphomethylpyrimidine kinase
VKIALTIAGSDSGGGAGIQADLKTFHQFGVFGTTAIVALTAQNTRGVRGVHAVPEAFVALQLEALADDLPPEALKTGMLAEPGLVRLVVETLRSRRWAPLVVDPVMAATSGDRLLTPEGELAIRELLLPLAAVVTPNLDEAAILAGHPVTEPASMERAGRALLAQGAAAALIKGGHLGGAVVVDLLVTPGGVRRFEHERMGTSATHGTGCTLSAAITAGLALGRPLDRAVEDAIGFVQRAMASAPRLGGGHGPLNHRAPAPS